MKGTLLVGINSYSLRACSLTACHSYVRELAVEDLMFYKWPHVFIYSTTYSFMGKKALNCFEAFPPPSPSQLLNIDLITNFFTTWTGVQFKRLQ